MAQDEGYDEVFDVEEYDDVYATYVEAKNRMNMMRTSRGFYPVVAMVPGSGGPFSGKSGKGRGKSPKGGSKKGGRNKMPPQKAGQEPLLAEICACDVGKLGTLPATAPATRKRSGRLMRTLTRP